MRAVDGRARVRVRWRLYQIFLNRLACSAADDGDDKITILYLQHTFLGTFLCHHWTTTTWKYLISRFMEDVNKRRRNSPFSFWSRMRFLRTDLQKRVRLHLIKVTASWNANSLLSNVFRRYRLRGILNSLVRAVCEPIDRVHSVKNISTVLEKRSHSEEDYCLVY